MKCPKCHKFLKTGAPSHAECGWGGESFTTTPYLQCDWQANGKRCHYTAAFSSGTLGQGPWYCRFHDGEKNPLHALEILEQSQDFRPQTLADIERAHQAEAHLFCQERGLDTTEKMIAFCGGKQAFKAVEPKREMETAK